MKMRSVTGAEQERSLLHALGDAAAQPNWLGATPSGNFAIKTNAGAELASAGLSVLGESKRVESSRLEIASELLDTYNSHDYNETDPHQRGDQS
jgi:hypothetical protein